MPSPSPAKPAPPPKKSVGVAKKAATAPAEGERRAMRGYVGQYRSAAAAIYASLDRGDLLWVEVASRPAGIADDLVLGFQGRVVGHQFKTAQRPGSFRVYTLLLGSNGLLAPLAAGWKGLRDVNRGVDIEIRLVTNEIPANDDAIVKGNAGSTSEAFLTELRAHRTRSLLNWDSTPWTEFIRELQDASALSPVEFEAFLRGFQLLSGPEADFSQLHRLNAYGARQAGEIAEKLPKLVADGAKERWSRAELLEELGWRDSAATRLVHRFPVGPYVQRNTRTEQLLSAALTSASSGYVSVIGPPGVGKSTLLQTSLLAEEKLSVIRYLAYVPGLAQGVGRGEADSFLDDVCGQLKSSGLQGVRFRNDTPQERREQFGAFLAQAGDRFQATGVRTIIVVDGLDHVPREEQPAQSFLSELPLPAAVPPGVVFVLGTQRLELPGLKPSVIAQAGMVGRRVDVLPLPQPVIEKMADLLHLDPGVSRARVWQVSQGHPLVARYLIEALNEQNEQGRRNLLDGGFQFTGDLEAVYTSAWRGLEDDESSRLVLDFLARAEGPMPLELLAGLVGEPAIEKALKAAKHLLQSSPRGWSVFHNSFRIYVVGKPKMRLGAVDTEHGTNVYRHLAQLARAAPASTAQRWQELRYRARALEHAAVLQLATQERFRAQLIDGRGDTELHTDFRLVLKAALNQGDPTAAMRALLIADEVSRRAEALAESEWFIPALLSASTLDAALDFAWDYEEHGLQVVDELLKSGDQARAEALFDHLDPVVQALSGRLRFSGTRERSEAFAQWASRLLFFRDGEQVEEAISRLVAHHQHASDRENPKTDEFEMQVRYRMLLGYVAENPEADAAALLTKYGKSQPWLANLMIRAARGYCARGEKTRAGDAILAAMQVPSFGDLPPSWIVPVARMLLEAGQDQAAGEVIDSTVVPSFADLDAVYDQESTQEMARELLEHVALSVQLGRPVPRPEEPKQGPIRKLQALVVRLGSRVGEAHKWRSSAGVNVAAQPALQVKFLQDAQSVLNFLAKTEPEGTEFFVHGRLGKAAEVLGPAIIRTAALWGGDTFGEVVRGFEDAVAQSAPRSALTRLAQQETALAIYHVDGNSESAAARLESHIGALMESTPSQQMDGLARLAVASAQIGKLERARQLIREALAQSLGTALTARKDAAYSMWMEVLCLANSVDPAKRRERTALLLRQSLGMSKTEGEAASQRMATLIVQEATWADPSFGFSAAQALSEVGSIEWPWIADSLLRGTIQRRPDLSQLCGLLWSRLAMPYLKAPHYQPDEVVGALPALTVAKMDAAAVPSFVSRILPSIESQARPDSRCAILRALADAARTRGIVSTQLDEALRRWITDAPLARTHETPSKHDDVKDLAALQASALAEEPMQFAGTSFCRAFVRLAPEGGYVAARAAFEATPPLHTEERAIFALADLAIDVGDHAYAKSLLDRYQALPRSSGTWTPMFSGDAQRYFKARIRLDGASVHAEAFKDFVESVLAGRENTRYLAWEIETLLPIIASRPDWAAVWDMIDQQLRASREFSIAGDVTAQAQACTAIECEEDLLAVLVKWAYDIPAGELNYQARSAMLEPLDVPGGPKVLAFTARTMLAAGGDAAAHALRALLVDLSDSSSASLLAQVQQAALSEDLVVAAYAGELCRRWGKPIGLPFASLPALYQLSLPPNESDSDDATAFRDPESGAMRVEYRGGWTEHLDFAVRPLLRGHVTREHVELRCKQLIDQWAGDRSAIEAFGHPADRRRQVELAQLGMRLAFHRPNIEIAVRALRVVACELLRARLLDPQEVSTLLIVFGWDPAALTHLVPTSIPVGLARPPMMREGYADSAEDQAWVDLVADDLVQPRPSEDRILLAEASRFSWRQARLADHQVERVRTRLQLDPQGSLSDWLRKVPSATWSSGGTLVATPPVSPGIVRTVYMGPLGRMPFHQLVICPILASRLRWTLHPTNRTLYRDSSGAVVAVMTWWRDGGPQDSTEDAWWADGCLIELTPVGRHQLETHIGNLRPLRSISRRSVSLLRERVRVLARTAEV